MRAADVVAALKFENGATGTITGTAGLAWQHPLFEITLTFEPRPLPLPRPRRTP